MNSLLDDLCDYNRTKLGLGINITPDDVDLADLVADTVDQLRTAHPARRIDLEVKDNVQGIWDGPRLQQLLSNLVLNAIRYGAPDEPVRVVVTGHDAEVRLEVRNSGPAIDPLSLQRLFDPLRRGPDQEHKNVDGLGLGLYIVSEITKAHQGSIEARSDQTGTAFDVLLPRRT